MIILNQSLYTLSRKHNAQWGVDFRGKEWKGCLWRPCALCGGIEVGNALRHALLHLDATPYSCPLCPTMQYTQSHGCTKHINAKHKGPHPPNSQRNSVE